MSDVLLMQEVWLSLQVDFYCYQSRGIIQGRMQTFLETPTFTKVMHAIYISKATAVKQHIWQQNLNLRDLEPENGSVFSPINALDVYENY